MKNSVLMAVCCWNTIFLKISKRCPHATKFEATHFLYKCQRTYTCLHVSNGLFLGQSDCKIDVQCTSNYENKNIV